MSWLGRPGGKTCPKSSAAYGQTALTGRSRAGRAKTQSKLTELGKTACFTKLGVFLSRVTQLRAQIQLSLNL